MSLQDDANELFEQFISAVRGLTATSDEAKYLPAEAAYDAFRQRRDLFDILDQDQQAKMGIEFGAMQGWQRDHNREVRYTWPPEPTNPVMPNSTNSG